MNKIQHYLLRTILMVLGCLIIGLTGWLIGRSNSSQSHGQILFVKGYGGLDPGIYVMSSDGDDIERLTWPMHFSSLPAWSPDGQTIAFRCHEQDLDNICLMGKDGLILIKKASYESIRPPQRVLNPANPPTNSRCKNLAIGSLSWATDGQQLAFTCWDSGAPEEQVCFTNLAGVGSCWSLTQITGQAQDFTSRSQVAWSPTDDTLAIASASNIYLSTLDGQQSRLLTVGEHPAWAPDGQTLAFFKDGQLLTIRRDGTQLQVLYETLPPLNVKDFEATPYLCDISPATWAPDGHSLAFVASASGGIDCYGSGIYTLNLQTSKIERLTPLFDGVFAEPNWSRVP